MKTLIVLAMGLAAVVGNVNAETALDNASKVRVPVKHIFIPKGFDQNDNIEIAVTGILPNLCYYGPSVRVSVKNRTINLEVSAYMRTAKALCPLVVVPFMLTARVGMLPKGTYKIVANGAVGTESTNSMNVTGSFTNTVDEHIYANVESVTRVAGTRLLELNGYNPSDCYQLDRIETVSNGKDTLAVLPIMKQIREACPMKMIPFKFQYEVPNTLNASEILIHVRSMKGASVNYLFLQNELE